MKITINKDFYIDVDAIGNYTLTEFLRKDTNKKGEIVDIVKTHGFFGNVRQALEKYIKLEIATNNEVMTIKEYLQEFQKQLEYFKNKFNL